MKKLSVIYLSIVYAIGNCVAGNTDSISTKQIPVKDITISVSANTSYLLHTNNFLRSSNDNTAIIAPDIRAGFRFSPSTRYGNLYPNVMQGIGINYSHIMPHSSLGSPTSIYLFQNIPYYSCGRWSLGAEWIFGISTGWKHYDKILSPENNALGSSTNANLGIGLSATYALNAKWRLKATLTANHYSNGNTNLPNAGVNTVGLQIGALYTIDVNANEPIIASHPEFQKGMTYDLTVYGGQRKRVAQDSSGDYVSVPGRFGVVGINIAPMYAFNRYLRAGISADLQYDESANLAKHLVDGTFDEGIKFHRQSFSECLSAGLSLHAELTLPIFSLDIGIGRNIVSGGPDTRNFYQTLSLKAYVWNNSFVNIGYQLNNFHLPNHLMIGIGYSFGRKH